MYCNLIYINNIITFKFTEFKVAKNIVCSILGSSSWITVRQVQFGELTASHCNADASGTADQHLAYMIFGEPFVDERASGHDIRFKFTGKERDSETGFDYFGARYYTSGLSIWLSVDPLADKYPSMSAYMYTAGNPVMLVDPDGMRIKPGNKEASRYTGSALTSLFRNSVIAMKFYHQEKGGDFVTNADMKNLSFRKFKREFKKANREYYKSQKDRYYSTPINGEGYQSSSKPKKNKVSNTEIKNAFNAYKKLDSENTYEMLVVSNKTTVVGSFYAKAINDNNTTEYSYASPDFSELVETFTIIENNNEPYFGLDIIFGTNLYATNICAQKKKYLNNNVPNNIKVFPSGNMIVNITDKNVSQSNSLVKEALIQ